MAPKVSVIIPNYNHAPYLKQRIESVLNQTFTDFEVIILDDVSTDNSTTIINTYAQHPKVSHIVINTQNSGSTFKQWEKGIALASGEWIWIAESDDWCEANFLEELMSHINSDDTVLAFAQTYLYDEYKKEYAATYLFKDINNLIQGDQFIKTQMLPYTNIWNASQAVFRKDVYYKIDKTYTNFKFCGDWIFWVEIAKRGSVFMSGKFLSYFRKHALDVTSKVTKSGLRYIEEFKALEYFDSLLNGFVTESNGFYIHFWNIITKRKISDKKIYNQLQSEYFRKIDFKHKIKLKLLKLRN